METSKLQIKSARPWLIAGTGTGAPVISSRIRLARNFRQFPFPLRAEHGDLERVTAKALDILPSLRAALGEELDCVWIEKLSPLERDILIEHELITPSLCRNPANRLVFIGHDRKISIMVNEDDHLRIQAFGSGLDLDAPLKTVNLIDDIVEEHADLAFDAKMGYLTACPTNLGTGLRASVLLHLPGLTYTQGIDSIVNITQQLGLSMRAVYVGGEKNQQYGNLFNVANQLTLGFSETEILANLQSAVKEILSHEAKARQTLKDYRGSQLEDMAWRAFGILRYVRLLGENEALDLFSKVRLGIDMGYINGVRAEFFGDALLAIQESYLKKIAERDNMTAGELEKWRGKMARIIMHQYIKPKE